MTSGYARPASLAGMASIIAQARCADAALDPDQWFPVSSDPGEARQEAAAAIAVCAACDVRRQCLQLSLRHWNTGQHGVWGGLVPAERAALRRPGPTGRPGPGASRRGQYDVIG